jgi:thiol-disulfide isomerase/thioredoxin
MTTCVRTIVVTFVAVLLIAGGSLATTAPAIAQRKAPKVRKTRALPAPRAKAIDAQQMQGLLKRDGTRPLLVNYWATWCDPCRDEFPDLVKIDADFRSKGLDFIAITLDDLVDLKTAVPQFLGKMNAKMPVYLLNERDPEPAINAVDAAWGGALPATFLYDKNGAVVYKRFGRVNTIELRTAIENLVNSKQQVVSGNAVP